MAAFITKPTGPDPVPLSWVPGQPCRLHDLIATDPDRIAGRRHIHLIALYYGED